MTSPQEKAAEQRRLTNRAILVSWILLAAFCIPIGLNPSASSTITFQARAAVAVWLVASLFGVWWTKDAP